MHVTADGNYDDAEAHRFIIATTGHVADHVAGVLALQREYLTAVGIDDATGHTFRFYDPATFVGSSELVDDGRIAADAEQILGIPHAVASEVLAAEFDYLAAKGLAG